MKIDDQTIKKYLKGTGENELRRFQDFLNTHTLKHTEFKGNSIPYYCSGQGEKTILTFSGGHTGPWGVYNFMLGFEDEFRVAVVDFSSCEHLDDFCHCANHVLDSEGIGHVCLTGQSLTGMFAQAYLLRNVERVEAMVLTNTLAPKRERNKKAALALMHLIPSFLLNPLLKRKLSGLGKIEGEITPEAEEKLRFRMALLLHDMDQVGSKKTLLNIIKMLFEFNAEETNYLEAFKQWPGKVLIVTAEDEPYREEVDFLMKIYPQTELYSFPAGWGHSAPLVHMHKFHSLLKNFFHHQIGESY
jgi:pimeloyl-ACP methyl ester carboxylesterase